MDSSNNDAEISAHLYGFARLNANNHEIRLLTLLPSRYIADQPQCRLKRVSLNENPKYEALSYTWGAPNPNSDTDLKERAKVTIEWKTVRATEICRKHFVT